MQVQLAFQDVPKISSQKAIINSVDEYGADTYLFTIEKVVETDYRTYVRDIVEAGFVISSSFEALRGERYGTIFKKEDRILTVLFISSIEKMWVCESKDFLAKDWDVNELFRELPILNIPNTMIIGPDHYGAGNYVVTVEGITHEDVQNYKEQLEVFGFAKYVEQKQNTIYTKDNMVLNITYIESLKRTYISASLQQPLSEHLFYNATEIAGNNPNAKTTLHMLELYDAGNSFVIQLKNGHFIVSDGGTGYELGYLFDYLEGLTPEGEKPVIEAWFISHAHIDHCGLLRRIVREPDYAGRVFVNGIYYNEPNDCVIALDPATRADIAFIRQSTEVLKTTKGENTKVYRPQTGHRYYFNDITVDIIAAQEQFPFEYYSGDFNDSSTWCLFTIEGQRCLLGGDGDKGGIKFVMETCTPEDMQLDVFTVLHHGHNTRDMFTDYCRIKTALFPVAKGKMPAYRTNENNHLKEVVEEWFVSHEGTVVMTFPYRVGEAKRIPHFDWIYNK